MNKQILSLGKTENFLVLGKKSYNGEIVSAKVGQVSVDGANVIDSNVILFMDSPLEFDNELFERITAKYGKSKTVVIVTTKKDYFNHHVNDGRVNNVMFVKESLTSEEIYLRIIKKYL